MATPTDKSSKENEMVEDLSLRDILGAFRRKWYWFLISLLFFMGAGGFYILKTQPKYERSAQVLVKGQDGGADIGGVSSAFSALGIFSSNPSTYNEMISLKSPALTVQVVKKLNLCMNYNKKTTFRWQTLYGKNLPFNVVLPDLGEEESAGFRLEENSDGGYTLKKFYKYVDGKKVKYSEEIQVKDLKVVAKSPIGKILFEKNSSYVPNPKDDDLVMKISRSGLNSTVEKYSAKLKVDLVDQDADVIELSFEDVSQQRAVDYINTVIDFYNEDWVKDKNKLAIAAAAFIDERLKNIEVELGVVDTDIADYQSSTLLLSLPVTAQTTIEQSAEISKGMLEVSNKLAMANYIKQFLANPASKYSVIPVTGGVGSEALANLIAEYNQVLLNRNNLAENTSDKNPLVKDYDSRLAGMRQSIDQTLKSDMASMESVLKNMQGAKGSTTAEMRKAPNQAKDLRTKERQQTVKESLYLYLLQKREENELSQTFTASNVRVITPPMGSLEPVSPKKKLILIATFILGLAVPGILIYLIESSDNKVRSRRDMDNIGMPFAGEIPQVGSKKFRKTDLLPSKHKKESAPLSVVEAGRRDVVNEAFRVVRSNLEFMIGKEKGCHVIMFTSFNPGSGKSFISYNLALSFALKDKKVLLIDGDLRHGSTSMYVGSPSKGLSTYLREAADEWRPFVKKASDSQNVDILPVGQLPPNPAELLDTERFGMMIKEARELYDYVIVDCPPVNIVVDTQIVEQYTDRTVFVVRAGLLEKSALVELDEFYRDNKFKHLSLILNGTESYKSSYYTYGNYQNLNN